MDPSENNFENQWKKAFNEASETPPPMVWERIEARLDQDENNKIVPLWWRSPKLWYAAASIAALLLAGGLWYSNRSGAPADRMDVATKLPSEKGGDSGKKGGEDERRNGIEDSISEDGNIASTRKTGEESLNEKAGSNKTNQSEIASLKVEGDQLGLIKSEGKRPQLSGKDVESTTGEQRESVLKENQVAGQASSKGNEEISRSGSTDKNTTREITKDIFAKDVAGSVSQRKEETIASKNQSMEVDLLSSIEYKPLDIFMQKRYVFYKPEVQAEEKLPEVKKPKEYWAGVGLMPGSFNPDVQIKEAPNAFAGQLASRQKSLTGKNEAGTSYAIQTQGGMRVSKHWSVELGLSYLQGNAKYQGGGYVLNAYANASSNASNVLQDALSNLSGSSKNNQPMNPTQGTGFANNSTLYIDVDKKVRNDYQYLQLPVQAGFTLRPDKKLSYSLLGGMMANFFLSNELEAATGETITTTASDDIYRSMNWAATTGLRFNYKLSTKWKASLTGSYQKAVSSGFRDNQSLESHPSLYGVSWGVRYSF